MDQTPKTQDAPRGVLRQLFAAALEAADPMRAIPPHLPSPPKGRLIVLGAGKASAAMAAAVEAHWPGPLEGVVVTRYGHAVPCRRIRILQAAHPTPDQAGLAATQEILKAADGAGPEDLVLALISGGGSALLCAPAEGVSFEEKQAITDALLRSGATIGEINTARRRLSAVKGGRLARRAAPAPVLTLAISDVPGDEPSAIASGPTVPDPTTRAQAIAVLERYGIALSEAARRHLDAPDAETPKPGDPVFDACRFELVATPQSALERAAERARALGFTPHILSDRIEGESRDAARVLAAIARQIAERGQPFAPPCVLLSGGETTVTLRRRSDGVGGPNAEFALALAEALQGAPGVYGLACDTDGVDGAAEVAGAIIDPESLRRAREKGLSPLQALDEHDAHRFFAALGDQIVTGPTLTNVNDFRAVLIT